MNCYNMIDYALKAKVISDNLDTKVSKLGFHTYQAYYNPEKYFENHSLEDLEQAQQEINELRLLNEKEFNEALKVSHANHKRKKHLSNYIKYLLQKNCIFLTFTFTDKTLQNTNAQTRRRYISRTLRQYNGEFVANIDFGEKNDREHYHAILQADKFNHTSWKYGLVNFEKIRNQTSDNIKLAKYITKLTRHAVKNTTKRNTLIYSRN